MWALFIDPTPGYVSSGLGKVGWDFWIDVHVGRILMLFCTPVGLTSYIFHNNTYYWEQRVLLLVKIIECKWYASDLRYISWFLLKIQAMALQTKIPPFYRRYSSIKCLRRGRDSNPRIGFAYYSLSRRAPSAARPPLRLRVFCEGKLTD